ncbi:MAG: SDR family oxidoreductase [Ignavibacteria bacterium]|jgi:NAD(P)-dependent dehydrogenase (short-subunit alcohol dehydrogenase family)|nr:SDR family oxidoreductase [Ignavibacteria bacterium]
MSKKKEYVLILGVSSGFGKAIAEGYAKQGYNIYGVHLDLGKAAAVVNDFRDNLVKKYGINVTLFNGNAAADDKRAEVLKYITKEESKHRMHSLVHSMAFGALKLFISENPEEMTSKKQIEMTMDVMANSLVYWTQDCFKNAMFAENSKIFAMTSIGSTRSTFAYGAVSAAKAALEAYIRQLAVELGPHKVSANAILAGVTDTPAARKIPRFESMLQRTRDYNPYRHNTTPELVAEAVMMLSNPDYYFINGQTIAVDGGENILNFAE